MRYSFVRVLFAALSVLLVLGCGSPSAAPEDGVRLLDPGAEPRSALRFDLDAFQAVSSRMVMDMETEMTGTNLPGGDMTTVMPRLQATGRHEPIGRDDDGNLRIAVHFGGIEVLPRPGADEELIQVMGEMLDEMRGLTGETIIDERGQHLGGTMDLDGVNPMLREQLEGQLHAFQDMFTGFPVEPVGTGGSWEVVSTMTQQGLTMQDRSVYTLVNRTDNAATMDFTSTQTGAAKAAGMDGLTIRGEGGGSMTISFTSLLSEAVMDLEIRAEFDDPEGGKITVVTRMHMELMADS